MKFLMRTKFLEYEKADEIAAYFKIDSPDQLNELVDIEIGDLTEVMRLIYQYKVAPYDHGKFDLSI